MTIPFVIEQTSKGERSYDLYSRLLKDRIVMLGQQVEDVGMQSLVAQMLFLDSESPKDPIHFYINSPGGYVTAGMALYDTMQIIKAPVYTYCLGHAASMGAVLLSGGQKGHRYILPSAEVMIHQPLGGAKGQASDILIRAKQIERTKNYLTKILADNCGQPFEKVLADCDRDYWMTAEEAVAYGIVDEIKPWKTTP